ncbi:MAG TPA: hypothetical protein VM328_06185 [Fimbriimonadaceae bacterium]|nr:hypothetical protein [Fimbriimonadaceae bacterium]
MLPKNRAFLAGLIAATALPAGAVTIDNFTQGTYALTANSIMPAVEAVRTGSTSAIAGGQRDALLRWFSGPLNVSAIVTGGAAQFFNSDSQTAGGLVLQYDGFDGEVEDGVLNNGSNLGLNLAGDDGIELRFRFLEAGLAGGMSILTTIQSAQGTASHTSFAANGTNFNHFIAFSNFAGVDFTTVQRIQFEFTGTQATDFTLTGIFTMPSGSGGGDVIPGPAAVLPFAAGVFAALRKRRQR